MDKLNTEQVPEPCIATEGSVLSHDIEDYPGGIIIPVDKPYRWTSADVIRKIKYAAIRHFGKKNLKVGHAGTLDPLATGVLIICIGKATKLAEKIQASDKEYVAGIVFGATTPSYDREKEIDRYFPYGHITEKDIRDALETFIGEQEQIAPLFSAKSVDGIRAYELARKLYSRQKDGHDGKIFDDAASELIRTTTIRIREMELLSYDSEYKPAPPDTDNGTSGNDGASSRIRIAGYEGPPLPRALIRISCSKGTYIRAVARDLGERLGSGAFLDSLQRSRSGIFGVDKSLSLEKIMEILKTRQ